MKLSRFALFELQFNGNPICKFALRNKQLLNRKAQRVVCLFVCLFGEQQKSALQTQTESTSVLLAMASWMLAASGFCVFANSASFASLRVSGARIANWILRSTLKVSCKSNANQNVFAKKRLLQLANKRAPHKMCLCFACFDKNNNKNNKKQQ